MEIKSFIFYLVQWTWGLPVNGIGAVAFLMMRSKGFRQRKFYHAWITELPDRRFRAVSIGLFIFIFYSDNDMAGCREWIQKISVHEYGHTCQVLFFGPFYWIIIGLPSLIWSLFFEKYRIKNNVSYYSLFCEAWANKLASIFVKF